MLITTKYRSSLNFGVVTFIVLELCPFTNGKLLNFSFLFSNFSLPLPNVMKFIHNTCYHKTQIKSKFGMVTLTVLQLCPFITLYATRASSVTHGHIPHLLYLFSSLNKYIGILLLLFPQDNFLNLPYPFLGDGG